MCSTCQARRRKANAALVLLMLLSSCAATPTSETPPPSVEWVGAAGASSFQQVVLRASSWKGIEPGRTTRAEVDQRFKPLGQIGKDAVAYRVDQIDTTINYDPAGKVASIRLPPASLVSPGELRRRFGKPDRIRELEAGARTFDYDRAGLTVEYPANRAAPSAVECRMPSKSADDAASELFLALVPIRPPLADVARRIQTVQDALAGNARDFSWVTSESETKQAAVVSAQFESKDLVLNAPDLNEYADGLMGRLASVTPSPAFDWKLRFIKGVLPNAMSLGGGYIFMTQGLLEQFDTESELAYVLAHEMAHQLRGDLGASKTRNVVAVALVLAGAIAVGALTGLPDVTNAATELGGGAAELGLAPFSRAEETEADLIAMDIIEAAGYDPRAALSTMERLKAVRDKYGGGLTIVSTHPELEARQDQINSWLDAHGSQDYANALVTTQEFIAIRGHYRLNPW